MVKLIAKKNLTIFFTVTKCESIGTPGPFGSLIVHSAGQQTWYVSCSIGSAVPQTSSRTMPKVDSFANVHISCSILLIHELISWQLVIFFSSSINMHINEGPFGHSYLSLIYDVIIQGSSFCHGCRTSEASQCLVSRRRGVGINNAYCSCRGVFRSLSTSQQLPLEKRVELRVCSRHSCLSRALTEIRQHRHLPSVCWSEVRWGGVAWGRGEAMHEWIDTRVKGVYCSQCNIALY